MHWITPLLLLASQAATPIPEPAPPEGPATAAQGTDPARRGLAVIAPAEFRSALEPLLAARAKELPVEFVALEELLREELTQGLSQRSPSAAASQPAPVLDPPEAIKRALHRRWRAGTLGYALLVGDADTFPVRFLVLDRVTEPAFHFAFYPSDLYYADLARDDGSFDDWNGVRDGFHGRYFGEVRGEHHKQDPINFDGISYTPEIAVGRWPVHTAQETAALVEKTLAHRPSAAPRALIVHADGWIDARGSARAMAEGLSARGFRVETQIYGEEPESPQGRAPEEAGIPFRGGAPGPARTLDALRKGPELALHLGHGSEQGWHACLGSPELSLLRSAPAAVYLSIGCSTAHFVTEPPYQPYLDESGIPHAGTNAGEVFAGPPPPPHWLQPGRFDSSGFGPELLLAPGGGALVYIGCTTGAQPCALTLQFAFQEALGTADSPRVGDAWRTALARYVERERLAELVPNDDWYPPSVFFQGMKFVFLGDPTLRL
ncbi:MAG: hypothetical protein IPK67_12240 [Planctomycetes bacterium]|nr:hypothetical protein [Planctomycetota bacterium]